MVVSGALKNDVDLRQQVAELRKDQRNLHAAVHIISTWFLIGLNFWVLKHYPNWMTYLFSFFFLGFMQYRLVMSTHESTHNILFFSVWLNEFFGFFHSAVVGISFFNYRRTHLEHHKNPQSIDEDIDSYIYRPLLETKPGLRRFALLVFGVAFDIAEKIGRKLKGAKRRDPNAEVVQNATPLWKQMLPIILCQAGLIALFSIYLQWWYYFVFWAGPVVLIALSLDRARTFVEHGFQYVFSNQTWESFKQ